MATISISKQHQKSPTEIEDLVDELTRVLEREYGCRCERNGDEIDIARRGISGKLSLHDQRVDVDITLGPMMGMLASRLTPLVEKQLDKHLDD